MRVKVFRMVFLILFYGVTKKHHKIKKIGPPLDINLRKNKYS